MPVDINGTTGVTTPGLASTAMPTSGGDPVVESGSNSQGYWVRWADGTQYCKQVYGESLVSVSTTGSGVHYKAYPGSSFPQPFLDSEAGGYVAVSVTINAAASGMFITTEGNTDVNGTIWPSFLVSRLESFNTSGRIMKTAFGRWK